MRREVPATSMSIHAMMQPISTSQVPSTHMCTSHHHQYRSLDMLVIAGNASRYSSVKGTRSRHSTHRMPVILRALKHVATTLYTKVSTTATMPSAAQRGASTY